MSEIEKTEPQRWEIKSYEILQICPCDNLLAVYSEKVDDDYELFSKPVHLLAVAKVTTRFMEAPAFGGDGHEYDKPETENQIVGLHVSEGDFDICNAADNFAGYMREGDDINEAIAYLPYAMWPSQSKRQV